MFVSKKGNMAQSRRVRISDSSLNVYGTRVLTEGVDFEQFSKNPILLWMHIRPWRGNKDDVLPLGVVQGICKEGDDIIGELVFDMKDEFAAKIAQKWDDGILKMVSPNFDIVAVDEDPALALPGQTRATVTKSKLIEVSVVDIGGNDANMVLSRDGQQLKLSEGGGCPDIPVLRNTHINNSKKMNDFKTIALKLGLPETATEDAILNTIGILLGYKTANETLRQENDQLKLSAITAEVDSAIAARKINADKKQHFISLGKTAGIDSLKLTFSAMSPVMKPTDLIHGDGVQLSAEFDGYKKLSEVPADKIMELRADKAMYMKLYKAEYGVDCPDY